MNDLEKRVIELERRLSHLERSDRYTFQKAIQLFDGRNVQVGVSTGTKFATSATQKIGFYGTTPVAQQTGVAATAGAIRTALINLGLITA